MAIREQTLPEAVRTAVRDQPEATAIRVGERTVSYREFLQRAERFGSGLLAQGHEPGERVALWLPNRPEWMIAFLGATLVGCPPVAVNSRYRTDELSHVLTDCEATTLVVQPSLGSRDYLAMASSVCPSIGAETGDEVASSVERVFVVQNDTAEDLPSSATGFESVLDAGNSDEVDYNIIDSSDTCGVFYTSGTTSAPKGVVHNHRSVVTHGEAIAEWFDVSSDDVGLLAMPAYGLIGFDFIWAVLLSGGTLIPQQRFDAAQAAATIERREVTFLFGVGDIFDALLATDRRLTSLERGSAILASPEQLRAVEERCEFPVVQPYGSTELHSHILVSHPDDPISERVHPGGPSVHEDIEVVVRDPETRETMDGGVGELLVRGYIQMDEYLENPDASAEAFDDEGWFVTGDLCEIDSRNHVRYHSRLDDALRVRGHLVAPDEVERAMLDRDGIAEAVVVGVETSPHQHRPVGFVRLSAGRANLNEAAFRDALDDSIADYKVPEAIVVVDEFPTVEGPNGEKIQRTALVERAKDHLPDLDPE